MEDIYENVNTTYAVQHVVVIIEIIKDGGLCDQPGSAIVYVCVYTVRLNQPELCVFLASAPVSVFTSRFGSQDTIRGNDSEEN